MLSFISHPHPLSLPLVLGDWKEAMESKTSSKLIIVYDIDIAFNRVRLGHQYFKFVIVALKKFGQVRLNLEI